MRGRIPRQKRPKAGIFEPLDQAAVEHASPLPAKSVIVRRAALTRDNEHAARLLRMAAQEKVDQGAPRGILSEAVQIDAGLDFCLAAADAALRGDVLQRAGGA